MAETLSRTPYTPNSFWHEGVDLTHILNKSAEEQRLAQLRAMQASVGRVGVAEVEAALDQEQDRAPSQAALQKLGSSAVLLTESGARSVGSAAEGFADGALALLGAERPLQQQQPLPRQTEYDLAR